MARVVAATEPDTDDGSEDPVRAMMQDLRERGGGEDVVRTASEMLGLGVGDADLSDADGSDGDGSGPGIDGPARSPTSGGGGSHGSALPAAFSVSAGGSMAGAGAGMRRSSLVHVSDGLSGETSMPATSHRRGSKSRVQMLDRAFGAESLARLPGTPETAFARGASIANLATGSVDGSGRSLLSASAAFSGSSAPGRASRGGSGGGSSGGGGGGGGNGADGEKRVTFRKSARAAVLLMQVKEDATFRKKLFGKMHSEAPLDVMANESWIARCCAYMVWPHSRFKQVWDVFFVMCLLWVIVRVPYLLAFAEEASVAAGTIDIAVDAVFLLDILVTFRTVQLDDGDVIADPKEVARRYVFGWFVVDLVASFPVNWFFPQLGVTRVTRLLRLLRVTRIEKAERTMMDLADVSERQQSILKMVKLFFYIGLAGHVSACVWYFIAETEGHNPNNWTVQYEVAHLGSTSKYLSALYWAFTTLTTVGYGDVSAHTDWERAFSLLMILMGAVVFATIVGRMSALSHEMNERETKRRKHQLSMNQFLRFYNLPKPLRSRTRKYYQNLGKLHPFFQNQKLLRGMSPALKRTIKLELARDILHAVPVFRLGSFGFQSMVASFLEPMFCLEGEWVVVHGEVAREMYFVLNGTVQIVDSDGTVMVLLETGNFFNEVPLLDSTLITASARAKTNVELYLMTKEHMVEVLKNFPTFETSLRKIATLTRHIQMGAATNARNRAMDAGSTRAGSERRMRGKPAEILPPPHGRRSWAEVTDRNRFHRYYNTMLGRSRTTQAAQYRPAPRDLKNVAMPSGVDERVVEFLARHNHEVWVFNRVWSGWEWGPARNNERREHPSVAPWTYISQASRDNSLAFTRQVLRNLVQDGFEVALVDASARDRAIGSWTFGSLVHEERDDDTSGGDATAGAGADWASGGSKDIAPSDVGAADKDGKHSRSPSATSASAGFGGGDAAGAGSGSTEKPGFSSDSRARAGAAGGGSAERFGDGLGSDSKQGTATDSKVDVSRPPVQAAPRAGPRYDRAVPAGMVYDPLPFPTDDEPLDDIPGLSAAVERIAQDSHELWAARKMQAGWLWGVATDERAKHNRCLLPFGFLRHADQSAARLAVEQQVRALLALGFILRKRTETATEDGPADGEDGLAAAPTRKRPAPTLNALRGGGIGGMGGRHSKSLRQMRPKGGLGGAYDSPLQQKDSFGSTAAAGAPAGGAAPETSGAGSAATVALQASVAKLEAKVGRMDAALAAIAGHLGVRVPQEPASPDHPLARRPRGGTGGGVGLGINISSPAMDSMRISDSHLAPDLRPAAPLSLDSIRGGPALDAASSRPGDLFAGAR